MGIRKPPLITACPFFFFLLSFTHTHTRSTATKTNVLNSIYPSKPSNLPPKLDKTPNFHLPGTTIKMQFSVVALVAAFSAVASASYSNGTIAYPSGTAAPTGSQPSPSIPFNNAAPVATGAGSAIAVMAAGAAALVRSSSSSPLC